MFGRLAPLFLALGILAPSFASACYAPPAPLIAHHTELVDQSDTIVLARVLGQSNKAGLHQGRIRQLAEFETLEVLRGSAALSFSLPNGFFVSSDDNKVGDFNRHRNSVFWDKHITRQWNESDCQMYPIFSAGRTYLLFLDRPHWRSYEEIRSPDDLWLKSVRRLIANPSLRSGISMPLEDWLTLSHSIFLGRIKTCLGPTISVDEPLHGSLGTEWRYSTHGDDGYWPGGNCLIGKRYLVVTYREEPYPLPYYSSSVFPLDDGRVDFRYAIADSDIEILGAPIRDADSLREALKIRSK